MERDELLADRRGRLHPASGADGTQVCSGDMLLERPSSRPFRPERSGPLSRYAVQKTGALPALASAFVAKQAARIVLGRTVDYGRQPEPIGDAQVWVMPSTSGLARGFWSVEPWQELAAAVR